jgi:hypothetical protein
MSFTEHSGRAGCAIAAVIGAMFFGAQNVSADIIHVPADYPTIQEAIDAAADGDEIIVAEGVYVEEINFCGKAIVVRSADPGDPDVVAGTIIDGDGAYHVVTCDSAEGADTHLSGFTITGAWADGELFPDACGGGMLNVGSSPTVSCCVFIDNFAAGSGGGMFNHQCSPTVIHCMFTLNTADYGGGMGNDWSACPVVMNCQFVENWVDGGGGGMSNLASSNPVIVNSVFKDAFCINGGGMWNHESSPTVTNCLFTDNVALWGGGMCNERFSDPVITNVTFSENGADEGSGLFNWRESRPILTNCILAGDVWSAEVENFDGGWAVLRYCNVQGGFEGYEGVGNIDADPLFVNPAKGDFRLQAGSPCIDAGANNALPADVFDLDEDADTAERIPLDLDDNPRFADDPSGDDTGCGAPVIVDMGAYEFAGEVWHPMRIGDIDGDGAVNGADLEILLEAWGGYEDECILADLDLSGEVNTGDLLALLANWG